MVGVSEIDKNQKMKVSAWLVGLYILTIPLGFVPLGALGSVTKMFALLPMGYILLTRIKRLTIRMISPILAILFFFLFSMVSLMYTIDTAGGVTRIVSLLLNYGLILVVASENWSDKEIDLFKKSVVWSAILCAVLALFASNVTGGSRSVLMIAGSEQDPNEFCGYFTFGALYFMDELIFNKRKLLGLVGFVVLLIPVFKTGSRGGMAAFLISACMFILMSLYSKRKTMTTKKFVAITFGVILLFILLFMVYQYWLPEELQLRLSFDSVKQDGGSGRDEIWKNILTHFETSSPLVQLFGNGAASVKQINKGMVAHNIYFETLIELGLIGLAILLWMYLSFVVTAAKQKSKICCATMIGYIVMGLTLSTYTYKPLFLCAMLILVQNRKDSKPAINRLHEKPIQRTIIQNIQR